MTKKLHMETACVTIRTPLPPYKIMGASAMVSDPSWYDVYA
jgi:hypothetical protein